MKHATITEATSIHDANLRLTRKRRGRPIHKILVSFSAAYFTGALVTDFVYWQMPVVMWERFLIWLIAAGLIMAGLVLLAYLMELAGPISVKTATVPPVAVLRPACNARASNA